MINRRLKLKDKQYTGSLRTVNVLGLLRCWDATFRKLGQRILVGGPLTYVLECVLCSTIPPLCAILILGQSTVVFLDLVLGPYSDILDSRDALIHNAGGKGVIQEVVATSCRALRISVRHLISVDHLTNCIISSGLVSTGSSRRLG